MLTHLKGVQFFGPVMLCALPLTLVSTAAANELEHIKVQVHKIDRNPLGSKIIYTVANESDRRIDSVRIACSLYAPDGSPAGAEIGYTDNIAPGEKVVGEAAALGSDVATAKCRPTAVRFARN